ncbi:hypothetical protein J6590_100139 [Homalodisca vitripennis]|nr:hypothetical protein J6590_100139 [Homalodisca vitripennis]
MELFWTNEKAAMAARPRPLPPSPPPSHTPRPLLDPLRRPPANGRAASPPPYESDGGRAMADGVMADEQKFVSPAADELCVAARYGCTCGAGRPALSAISCSFLALRLWCCYLVETAHNMLIAASEDAKKSMPTTAYNIMVTASEAAKKKVCQAIQDLNPGPAEQLSRVGEHNLVTAHGDRADTAVHSNDYNYACVYQTILLCNIVTKRMKLHNTHVDTYVNPTPDRVWDCPGAYTPRLRHHMVHKVGPEILVVTLRTT